MATLADHAVRMCYFDGYGGDLLMHQFHYDSMRARESRAGKVFDSWIVRTLLKIAIVALGYFRWLLDVYHA